jgi:glycosyltransferase involved in cell wall biosynthesis
MKKIPYLPIESIVILLASRVIFTSVAERETFVLPRWLWVGKSIVIPEPFEGAALKEVPSHGQKTAPPITMGFLAAISARKGLYELVEGFALFCKRHPDIPLNLRIGGASRKGFEAYSAKAQDVLRAQHVSERVEWHGNVAISDRSAFYESLDFFVCPSQFESFGLTPLEALWHGIPIAVGPRLGVREYLSSSEAIFAFNDLTPETIAGGLHAIVAKLETAKARAREGRGHIIPALAPAALAGAFQVVIGATD